MKRYSIFHPLILSFFSKSLYRDVGKNWRGTGLLYLLMVLALVWIPTVIRGQLNISQWVEGDGKEVAKQVPPITIQNGEASTNATMPYFIRDPKTGADIAIIDTTGEIETLDNSEAKFLLTKTKLIASKNENETRTYDLSAVGSFYLDGPRLQGWLATLRQWFIPVAYPLALGFSFALRTIQILIYALVGLLFAKMLDAKLDFKTLMRLATIALTPVLLLNLLLEFIPLRIPGWSLLGIVVALAYLFFAVKVNTGAEEAPMYQPPPPPPPLAS